MQKEKDHLATLHCHGYEEKEWKSRTRGSLRTTEWFIKLNEVYSIAIFFRAFWYLFAPLCARGTVRRGPLTSEISFEMSNWDIGRSNCAARLLLSLREVQVALWPVNTEFIDPVVGEKLICTKINFPLLRTKPPVIGRSEVFILRCIYGCKVLP